MSTLGENIIELRESWGKSDSCYYMQFLHLIFADLFQWAGWGGPTQMTQAVWNLITKVYYKNQKKLHDRLLQEAVLFEKTS